MKPTEPNDNAIRIAAHDWHIRNLDNGLTQREQDKLDRWLDADPRHRSAFQRAGQLWHETGSLTFADVPAAALQPLPGERFRSWLRAGWGRWTYRLVSTSLVAGAAAAIMMQILPFGFFDPGADHFETGIAETRDVVLADGSTVTLGARTQISVDMTGETRKIALHRGEAYFAVQSDAERPFAVQVDDALVTVVGTEFNVSQREDGFVVAVAEGIVDVSPVDAGNPDRLTVEAGTRADISHTGSANGTATINADDLAAWRQDRLVYLGATLEDVIADANRYDAAWIVMRDESAAQHRITASFDATDIDAMLATLEQVLPISIWRPVDGIAVIESKPDAEPK
ncbi:MAG: FecR domain-containing protein [Pseudomonadota bacterium]